MFHHEHEKLLREILHVEKEILCVLREIRGLLRYPPIQSFIIEQENSMPLTPLAPGFSPVFTATPVPTGAVLNPSQPVPAWTSSDTVNAPVSVDVTGLIATVAIPASAVVGTSFTLTVSYTNLDGSVATGTLAQTIVAAPPVDVTSFNIAQTQ